MFSRFLLGIAFILAPTSAFAWGATGHEYVSGVAAQLLPAEVPSFVRGKDAVATIAQYGRELDRSKGAGKTHDGERDPGHFVDLFDNGQVMGVLAFSALPETRGEYDALLNASGTDQYKAGYLPYSIVDGYQQIVKDFGYWRASGIAAKNAKSAADRAYFKADVKRREALTLRDIGVWTHYLGDAAQPLHASVHYDIWGMPNPNNYNQTKGFHQRFEGQWLRANIKRAAVLAAVPAFHDCACPLMQRVTGFLTETESEVEPLFKLEAKGVFPAPALVSGGAPIPAASTDPEAAAFATKALARGAAEARDLIVLAWRDSAHAVVGYPGVNVADVMSGKVVLTTTMYAND